MIAQWSSAGCRKTLSGMPQPVDSVPQAWDQEVFTAGAGTPNASRSAHSCHSPFLSSPALSSWKQTCGAVPPGGGCSVAAWGTTENTQIHFQAAVLPLLLLLLDGTALHTSALRRTMQGQTAYRFIRQTSWRQEQPLPDLILPKTCREIPSGSSSGSRMPLSSEKLWGALNLKMMASNSVDPQLPVFMLLMSFPEEAGKRWSLFLYSEFGCLYPRRTVDNAEWCFSLEGNFLSEEVQSQKLLIIIVLFKSSVGRGSVLIAHFLEKAAVDIAVTNKNLPVKDGPFQVDCLKGPGLRYFLVPPSDHCRRDYLCPQQQNIKQLEKGLKVCPTSLPTIKMVQ